MKQALSDYTGTYCANCEKSIMVLVKKWEANNNHCSWCKKKIFPPEKVKKEVKEKIKRPEYDNLVTNKQGKIILKHHV